MKKLSRDELKHLLDLCKKNLVRQIPLLSHKLSVGDPGFPRGGGANSQGGGGAPTYNFAKFSQKLHEIEWIRTRGEHASLVPP